VESVEASVHFEEAASRPLLLVRVLLFPFIMLFIVLNLAANLLVSPIFTAIFALHRHRSQGLFSIPSLSMHQIGNWSALSLLLSDRWPPDAATVRISFIPLASRFELFFRPIFGVMLSFNALVFSVPASLALALQFLHILIFGHRRKGLHSFLESYWKYGMEMGAYVFHGTDERPMLLPLQMRPHNWYRLLE
jgi:hypothetical protein